MRYVGISSGFHDAAISVVDESGEIKFAGHSERYSKKKHDSNICSALLADVLSHCDHESKLHYYERPWLKFIRQLRSGESPSISSLRTSSLVGNEIFDMLGVTKIQTHSHHLCHAAAGFQTGPYDKATVVVIDAIGEFDTISIWGAMYVNGIARYKKLWSQSYPDSIGLFYSAMTDRIGLRPLDEEYILMGMAAYGSNHLKNTIRDASVGDMKNITMRQNFHTGISSDFLSDHNSFDIATGTQLVVEELINSVMHKAKTFAFSDNLVYMGGVALNCLANRNLGNFFKNIWIMPNPGDAGSSLGAAALGYGGKINWKDAYLGHNISGKYPVDNVVNHLLTHGIVGIANGRAEFGPRALGNRSLIADPRGQTIKEKVNHIKRRQQFRPFAPVILEEHAQDYFEMPRGWSNSQYMQTVATCKYPTQYPAIVHADGTSRVQTVPAGNSGIRQMLELWYAKTSCPMLLNTSLNIRGEPMVNDRADADRFEREYGVKVFS
jgi:carbamoyltransferase